MTPLRLLLVEDSKYDAELVEGELRREGYDLVLEHVDGAEGMVAALEGQPWDLILCDYNIPGFGAMEALAVLDERGVDTPFIILSGSIGEEATVEALKAGARDVVLKSNLPRVAPVLERTLKDAETRRAQREAEQRLRESEQRLRLALEAGRVVIWDHDLRTGKIDSSGYSFDVPGLRREDLKTFDDFLCAIHPDDRDVVSLALDGGSGAAMPQDLEFRLQGADGTVRWVSSRGILVRDDAGEAVRVLGIAPDITARKLAETELEESNALLRALLDSSPLAIAATDLDRRLTIWNTAAERLFGWRADEVIGRVSPVIPEEELARLETFFERLWQGEAIVDVETTRVHKDGTPIVVSLSLAPMPGEGGSFSGTVGIFVDVSERKRAREELQRSLELLRSANEDRRRLLERLVQAQEEERQRIAADIHDDSVQVLTALALRLGIASTGAPDPETSRMLGEAERTAQTAIDRLRRLMFELRPPALDREGLVEALRIYLDQMASEHGLEYSLDGRVHSEPGPETRATIYRIVQEALVNIAKHARARHVRVRLEERGGGVWASVVDDGVGFSGLRPDEQVGHVGLDSMRERAELSGGWWKIDSTPGSGTVVEFFLPMRTEAAA